MPEERPRILLVDDDPGTLFGFTRYLQHVGYAVETASTLGEGKEKIQKAHFDVILLDLKLPDGNGIDWIPEIRENTPEVALVVITAHGDIPLAVEAMRKGADHFLTKPVNMPELEVFLRKSLELGSLRRVTLTTQRLKTSFSPYFGESKAMQKVLELAKVAIESDSPVLLVGETGTGKGVLARWIHEHSARARNQFVEINCTSLKGDLLASELFGHAKGAFTSAVSDKQGLIEVADQGTLFLDEIGDMDLPIQAQFLKVIEEKQFRRLGEIKVRRSDFRLICASNKLLLEEVEKGHFRKDLFYRINVFPIALPPLRERLEDLEGLIRYFLKLQGRESIEISSEVIEYLKKYSWPGNVRELRNVLERALLLAKQSPLHMEHFPGLGPQIISEKVDLDLVEAQYVQSVVAKFNGDTKKAAEALGISRATLYRKLSKLQSK